MTENDRPRIELNWREMSLAQLWKRFLQAENRGLALRSILLHILRALYVRARRLLGLVRRQLREIKLQLIMAGAVVIGRLRNPHQVIEHWTSPTQPLGGRVVLFVHFDGAGRVIPTTRAFMTALAEAGLSVVFVTNSEKIEPEAKLFLQQTCQSYLIRRNIGYDFGAWRDALDTLGLPRVETDAIFMVNDSVYGPFGEIATMLAGLDFDRAQIWGLTESWQHRYHLQSFFLACGGEAIRSPVWRDFWRSVRPVPYKEWIIRHCEIGFTAALQKGGLTCAALYPQAELLGPEEIARLRDLVRGDRGRRGARDAAHYRAIHARRLLVSVDRNRRDLNPSIDLWRQLLRAGYPFVKRELLHKNPSRIADVFDWEAEIRAGGKVDPEPLAHALTAQFGEKLQAIWNVPAEKATGEKNN